MQASAASEKNEVKIQELRFALIMLFIFIYSIQIKIIEMFSLFCGMAVGLLKLMVNDGPYTAAYVAYA